MMDGKVSITVEGIDGSIVERHGFRVGDHVTHPLMALGGGRDDGAIGQVMGFREGNEKDVYLRCLNGTAAWVRLERSSGWFTVPTDDIPAVLRYYRACGTAIRGMGDGGSAPASPGGNWVLGGKVYDA